MRFTKEEFLTAINKLKEMLNQEETMAKALGVCEWKAVNWIDNYYDLITDMCDIDRSIEGPYNVNALDYFVWELDFGAKWKPYCCTINGVDIPLKTPEDLWNLLNQKI